MALLTDAEIALDPDVQDQFRRFIKALQIAQQNDPIKWDVGPLMIQHAVLFANICHKKYGWGRNEDYPKRNTKQPVE